MLNVAKAVQLVGGPADGETMVIDGAMHDRGVIVMHRYHFTEWQGHEDDPVPVRNVYYRKHPKHENIWIYDEESG